MQLSESPILLEDYKPYPFSLTSVDLRFDLHEDHANVESTLNFERSVSNERDLTLDGVGLELQELRLDGRLLNENEFLESENGVTIFGVPDAFRLDVRTRVYPQKNTALEGLYRSHGMFCTQCEAEGFRRITLFPDRPDVLSRFTTTIEADARDYPTLLSNGNCIAEVTKEGRRVVTWEDPHPKPAYLFALVAGDLHVLQDRFTTRSGREVALAIYSEPHNVDKCGFAMDCLKKAMRWDEEAYGREYDLDQFMIVAVEHFNMGAMENKGLNIFNTAALLANPDIATDDRFRRVMTVVSHEYFHNWSGNRVTCRDWFQLSLKEGFTVFRDQSFSADMHGAAVKRVEDVERLRSMQFPEDQGPMAHAVRPDAYVEISNFYTTTIYEKGAEVIRALAGLLGADTWREATDRYFEENDGRAATVEDFLKAAEHVSGRDLTHFKRWYTQSGNPTIEVEEHCDDSTRTLRLRQTNSPTNDQTTPKQPLLVPLALGVIDADGNEVLDNEQVPISSELAFTEPNNDRTFVFEMDRPSASIELRNVNEDAEISFMRDFSAPVSVRYRKPSGASSETQRLGQLARKDTNGYIRWDATQGLLIRAIREGTGSTAQDTVVSLFKSLATAALDSETESAEVETLALAMNVPSELVVLDTNPGIELDELVRQRQLLLSSLARECDDLWQKLLTRFSSDRDYSPEPANVAERRMKNCALGFVVRQMSGDPAAAELLSQRFDAANNLTDRLAAFELLLSVANEPSVIAEQVSERFLTAWHHEALVVDHWFAAHARARLDDGLRRTERLLQHELFDLGVPNRVRAVLDNFAERNVPNFHKSDGSGYRFYTDVLIELDALNPQLAARMSQPLTRWQRYDKNRKSLIKTNLERLLDSVKSNVTRDMAQRALAAA